jgi:gluconokinase
MISKPVIVVMGVTGCGKSTIGKNLKDNHPDVMFIEGDDLHSKEHVEKMAQGIPLTDEDRYPWLLAIHDRLLSFVIDDHYRCVIVTCSALKHEYRELLVKGRENKIMFRPLFLHLKGDYKMLEERLLKREGHYMKANMLKSQFDILEWPDKDIHGDPNTIYDTLTIKITADQSPDQVSEIAREKLAQFGIQV